MVRQIALSAILIFICTLTAVAQAKVGIGTTAPDRILDIKDSFPVALRIHSTTGGASMESGLLLMRNGNANRDFQFINQGGNFNILMSNDDFATSEPVFRLKYTGEVGLGTQYPIARMHVIGNEEATNSTDGYLVIGDKNNKNLVLDANEINARNNGAASSLTFQADGGDVVFQNSGGSTFLAPSSGYVTAGNANGSAKFNIGDNGFQLHFRNTDGQDNNWYIGASEDNWAAGDNQLLFSFGNSSASSIFRLSTTTDNDGDQAPVMIRNSASQALLLDGNEIDAKHTPLFFNYNSGQDTYINPTGGNVGIGTSNPGATLHVKGASGQFVLAFERPGQVWNIHPYPNTNNLGFRHNNNLIAHVDDASGAWVALSDRRFKQEIRDMENVLSYINNIDLKSYSFIHDTESHQQIGVLAQKIKEIFPEVVNESPSGRLSVSYSQLSVVAIKALQEQDAQITALENELKALIMELEAPTQLAEEDLNNISPQSTQGNK